MLMNITTNLAEVRRRLSGLEKQVNFAASKALNDTAREVRKAAATMPAGKPGECDLCGEWSARLVRGACAPCRDRFKLG